VTGHGPAFIDETVMTVSSGRGGDGVVSFRREKYVPKGGPDGGDGGRGGHVLLRSNTNLSTLAGIQPGRRYRAGSGQQGSGSRKNGANGESLVIEVPVGTLVRDADRGHVLRDLDGPDIEFAVVRGGDGGVGNTHFASSTNQTPRQSTAGKPGETRELRLELRLVADIGLVGLPNAGKSTFLRRVSRARPKVADYPFTTLEPMLGLVTFPGGDGMVIADIPGLIEGAHTGAGLGDRFLRHVARTRVLLHLVEACESPAETVTAWRTIRAELAASELELEDKPCLLALSKADLAVDSQAYLEALEEAAGVPVALFSSHTGEGVDELLGSLRRLVAEVREAGKDDAPEPSKT
jgi:GTP-binding protein